MKKDKTKTPGYHWVEILIAIAFMTLMMLIAGTLDYNDAKETETYWKTQTK